VVLFLNDKNREKRKEALVGVEDYLADNVLLI